MSDIIKAWAATASIVLSILTPLWVIAEPVVKQRVEYYVISPQTVESIKIELGEKSPIQKNNRVFHGQTTWQVVPMIKWKSVDDKCGIVAINVELHTKFLMPSLHKRSLVVPEVKQVFDVYYAGLLKHEQGHHELGLAAAKEIERFLSRFGLVENCDKLESAVTQRIEALIQHFKLKNGEYDKKTGYGRSQGAVIQ